MKQPLPILLIVLLLPGCGSWTCTASPTLGHDAKQAMRVQGFDMKCSKRF